ncbi:MAG: chemotaxis protein CheW [Dissulfurimicrobium sp.]|uniref:chemotaxis protein CheW n=1 Tax=Dissulfurimicrobium sp. TaxID=2022436 RepID=UPI00404B11DD
MLYPVIFFKLKEQLWAIGLDWVQEVLQSKGLRPMPNAHPSIAGLLNVRGQVLPVLRGRDVLMAQNIGETSHEMPLEEKSVQNRVLLIGINDMRIGLAVDSVIQIGKLDMEKTWLNEDIPGDKDATPWNVDFLLKLVRAEDGAPIPVLNIPRLVDYVTGISGVIKQ